MCFRLTRVRLHKLLLPFIEKLYSLMYFAHIFKDTISSIATVMQKVKKNGDLFIYLSPKKSKYDHRRYFREVCSFSLDLRYNLASATNRLSISIFKTSLRSLDASGRLTSDVFWREVYWEQWEKEICLFRRLSRTSISSLYQLKYSDRFLV